MATFCSYAIVLEFKLRNLKNLKLFFIRVKELFESIVFFLNQRHSLFLKAFSWETDLWVRLGDFTVKKKKRNKTKTKNRKIGKENLHLTEIDSVETKYGARNVSHVCKWIFRFKFNFLTKYKSPQISHFRKTCVIFLSLIGSP